jgi:hypothetical protein
MMEKDLGADDDIDPLQRNLYMHRDVGTANNNL